MSRLEDVIRRARGADEASKPDDSLASCIFTGTGFSGCNRVHLRTLCSLRGIKYSGDLCRNSTTHLVVNNQNNVCVQPSEKLSKAVQWSIAIVSLDSFLDLIEKGMTQDESENCPVASAAKRQPSPADCSIDNRLEPVLPNQADRQPLNAVENTLASYMQQLEISPGISSQMYPSHASEPWPLQLGGGLLQSQEDGRHSPPPGASPMVAVQERNTSPTPELSLRQYIMSPLATSNDHTASEINVDDDCLVTCGELETDSWAEPQPSQPKFPTPDWGSEEDFDETNELILGRGMVEISSPAVAQGKSLSSSDDQVASLDALKNDCLFAPAEPEPSQREGSATPLDQHRLQGFIAIETESQDCLYGENLLDHQHEETPLPSESNILDHQDGEKTSLASARNSQDYVTEESVISEGSSQDLPQQNQLGGPAVVVRAPRLPLPIPCAAEDDTIPTKLLLRAPRGSTVKARHNLRDLKGAKATFAETIYLPRRELRLSVKEKAIALVLQNDEGLVGAAVREVNDPVLVQPLSFYRLLGEDWMMECVRFYTGSQALALAGASGAAFTLPSDFDSECELLRSSEREHVELSRVEATVAARQVKPGTAVLRVKNSSDAVPAYFWRREIDPCVPCLVMPLGK